MLCLMLGGLSFKPWPLIAGAGAICLAIVLGSRQALTLRWDMPFSGWPSEVSQGIVTMRGGHQNHTGSQCYPECVSPIST